MTGANLCSYFGGFKSDNYLFCVTISTQYMCAQIITYTYIQKSRFRRRATTNLECRATPLEVGDEDLNVGKCGKMGMISKK